MALLRVLGVRDRAGQIAAEAALRAADAQAVINPDWITGVVDVTGVARVEILCAALRDAGFMAAPLTQRPGLIGPRDILRLLLRALAFSAAAGIGGVILGLGLGILNVVLNPSCQAAHDEGACAMGIMMIGVGMGFIGALIAAAMTLIRGCLRLAYVRRTGRDLPFG
jgi:hypothetical protein